MKPPTYFSIFPEEIGRYLSPDFLGIKNVQRHVRDNWGTVAERSNRNRLRESLLSEVREAQSVYEESLREISSLHQKHTDGLQSYSLKNASLILSQQINMDSVTSAFVDFLYGGKEKELQAATYISNLKDGMRSDLKDEKRDLQFAKSLAAQGVLYEQVMTVRTIISRMDTTEEQLKFPIDPEKGLRYLQVNWDFVQRSKDPETNHKENLRLWKMARGDSDDNDDDLNWSLGMRDFFEKTTPDRLPERVQPAVRLALHNKEWLRQTVIEDFLDLQIGEMGDVVEKHKTSRQVFVDVIPLLGKFAQANDEPERDALAGEITALLKDVASSVAMGEIWKCPEFQQQNLKPSDNEIKDRLREQKEPSRRQEIKALSTPVDGRYGQNYITAIQASRTPPFIDNEAWWQQHLSHCPEADRDAVFAMKNFCQTFNTMRLLPKIEDLQNYVREYHQDYIEATIKNALSDWKWQQLRTIFSSVETYQAPPKETLDAYSKDVGMDRLRGLAKRLDNDKTLEKGEKVMAILNASIAITDIALLLKIWNKPLAELNIPKDDITCLSMLRDFCIQYPNTISKNDLRHTQANAVAMCREQLITLGVSEKELDTAIPASIGKVSVLDSSQASTEAPTWAEDEAALQMINELKNTKIKDGQAVLADIKKYRATLITAEQKNNKEKMLPIIKGVLEKQYSERKALFHAALHFVTNEKEQMPANIADALQKTAVAIQDAIDHKKILASINDAAVVAKIEQEGIKLRPFRPGKRTVFVDTKFSANTFLLRDPKKNLKEAFVASEADIQEKYRKKLKVGSTASIEFVMPHKESKIGHGRK